MPLALATDTVLSDPGPRPRFAWLSLDALTVDPRYQRDIETERSRANIRQIAAAFVWTKFQPVTVCATATAGAYAVIDGQHRVAAARLRPDIPQIPCWIVAAPELRGQARAFVGINRDRVTITPIQMHHAAVAAGDPDALHLAEICARTDIEIPRHQISSGQLSVKQTLALATLRKALAQHGDGPVMAALTLLRAAWPETPAQLRGALIAGAVAFFVQHKGREIDRDRLARALAETSAADLEEQARALRTAFGGQAVLALRQILTRMHNKGLRDERRLPEV